MWHSARKEDDPARRYSMAELAALIEPLALVIDGLGHMRVADLVDESILQRMTADELVYALFETFEALSGDAPVPPAGHPGYQHAIVFELLTQLQGLVEAELLDAASGADDRARRAAWDSFLALCGEDDEAGRRVYPLIEHLELIYERPDAHCCPLLTAAVWNDMLLDESAGVLAEFVDNDDWRLDWLLDHPREQTAFLLQETGIDLDTVQRLPHTPSAAEAAAAREYLRALALRHERAD
jgi:hypothetical protein